MKMNSRVPWTHTSIQAGGTPRKWHAYAVVEWKNSAHD